MAFSSCGSSATIASVVRISAVIALKTLKDFTRKPGREDAREPVLAWYRLSKEKSPRVRRGDTRDFLFHRGRRPLNPHKTISPITYKMRQGTELDSTKRTILKTLRLGTRKSQLALWQAFTSSAIELIVCPDNTQVPRRRLLIDIATMAGR